MNPEEDDLSRELFPLSHYAGNRKRLVNEAFTILQGPRLESTIPPSLKGIDFTELKSLCVEELEKIDTLKIVDIIEGRVKPKSETPPASTVPDRTASPVPVKKRKTKEENISIPLSSLKKSIKKSLKTTEDGELNVQIKLAKKKKEKKKKEKKATRKESSQSTASATVASSHKKKKAKVKKAKKEKKYVKPDKNTKQHTPEPARQTSQTGERTLMELLELEYRAKAIKALLHFQGFKDAKIDHIFEDTTKKRESSQGSAKLVQEIPREHPKVSEAALLIPESLKITVEAKSKEQELVVFSDEKSGASNAQVGTLNTSVEVTDSFSENIPKDISKNIESAPSNLQPIKKISDRSFYPVERIDDDLLDYENPDDLEDVRSTAASTPNSRETASSSESEVEAEIEDSVALVADGLKKAAVNHEDSIPSDVDDVSEEEEGEIAFANNSPGQNSRQSTPPQLSPAYSDAGDFKVTLRASPIPVQSSCPSSPEQEKDLTLKAESVKNHNEQVSNESLSDGEIGAVHNEVEPSDILVDNKFYKTSTHVESISLPEEIAQTTATNKSVCYTMDTIAALRNSTPATIPHDTEVRIDHQDAIDAEVQPEKKSDPSNPNDCENDEDADAINIRNPTQYPDEATPITWYERWYSSKKVQKVVTSTKMYGKVRNKLKVEKKATRANNEILHEKAALVEASSSTQDEAEDVPIIGSIQEYEKLFGRTIVSQNLDNVAAMEIASAAAKLHTEAEHSDAQSEEADDDDLWGDIIGST